MVTKVYEFYAEVAKKRNEYIIKHIDEMIKDDEVGMLLMREGHQLQFPADVEVFYISPPALDEIEVCVFEDTHDVSLYGYRLQSGER